MCIYIYIYMFIYIYIYIYTYTQSLLVDFLLGAFSELRQAGEMQGRRKRGRAAENK